MFSPPFYPAHQKMVCKMALVFKDVNKYFLQKKHPKEDGRAYFSGAQEEPEEKPGKFMRPMMMIGFNGSLLGKGLIGTGHKKALP